MKYEAWISDRATLGVKGNRFVEIEAPGVKAAYRLAEAECGDGEFIRGVNGVEETTECNCGIEGNPDYEAIHERHGPETHSPYCPVGIIERAAV